MIPIKLELQGLYSYKEKQTVDFAQLTAAGLFGIFGAVGSGKSSILEAIMLALYGNTERLAARGEKTSMVNLQSDMLSISFEFKAGKNNAETYKATYVSKRNKKNFDDVKPAEHLFYQKTEEGWMPIAQRAEELVGMKMEHFRQTVIIPQGKFRDFIEQKPMARAEMMKELFGLERFDLSANTGRLLKDNNEQKIRLQTQIQSLQDISLERQQEKESLRQELNGRKTEQEKEVKSYEATVNHLRSIQEKHLQLLDLENQQRNILVEKPTIEHKKEQLRMFRKAIAFIKPVLDQLKEKELEVEKFSISVTDCSRWKTEYETSVAQLETEEQKLKIGQSKKSERETKIRDLQKIITIKSLGQELNTHQKAVDQMVPNSEKKKSQLAELQQQINNLEAQEEQIKVPDAQTLADLKNMVREFHQLEAAHALLLKDLQLLESQKSNTEQSIRTLKELLPSDIQNFKDWATNQNTLQEEAQRQREKLIQHQGLSAYSLHLHEGENCPLCGSREHPEPLSQHFDDGQIEKNALLIQELKRGIENIRKHQASWDKESMQMEVTKANLDQKMKEIAAKAMEEEVLMKKLEALEIAGKEQLLSLLDDYEKAFDEQQGIVQLLKKLRRDYQNKKEQLDQEDRALKIAEQQLLKLHATLSAQKGEVKFPDLISKYLTLPEAKIQQDMETVQKAIDELELNLTRTQDKLREARQGQATNLANLHHFKKLLEEAKEKHTSLQDVLSQQILESGFSSQQEVSRLLGGQADPDQWEEEIKSYENRAELIKAKLAELEENQGIRQFDENKFRDLSLQLQSGREALDRTNAQLAVLLQEIEEIRSKLGQKTALNLELEKVEKRELNLKELERLFKGNGFVKYVSSIYLKELCQTANQRFMTLTKNSLSLEIDEENTFWVRDYLNGGKKRLLKSLSGGQTFQASLCLALALAEKVKSLNRAEQSFFFLDEGFGALDRASLRTVFEALKSLRHEHRVVGIISHVEELQQEIEVYAKVELDGELGSQVTYSF
jgi:exonuclease SbcC